MTHSLHRQLTDSGREKDFTVIMLRAMGVNNEGYLPKCQEFLRIAARHNALNLSSEMKGNRLLFSLEEIVADAEGDSQALFGSPEDLTSFLRALRKADLGLSVTVSGDFDIVDRCFSEAGLKHHSANFSLGIWGKTEALPSPEVLRVTTLCGHGMVPPKLVETMVEEIRMGKRTPEDAARVLALPCKCGIFDHELAAELLAEMA